MDNKDKVVITLSLERQKNGTINRTTDIQGEGFHLFELVGLLQMTCYDMAKQSMETATEMPKDKETKLVFGEGRKKI